jgi:hypothetical protein
MTSIILLIIAIAVAFAIFSSCLLPLGLGWAKGHFAAGECGG